MKKITLSEIIANSGGDFRKKTLHKVGLNSEEASFVVKVLDNHNITKCPGKRQRRTLAVSLDTARQLALNIPFDTLYRNWSTKRRNPNHKRRKTYTPSSADRVRIANDQYYDGAVLPAVQVLTPPEKMFTKDELQRGEGYGEFDVGATATVIETGDVYVYNGYRWVKQDTAQMAQAS